jgi:serine/threonine protein kinase
MIASGAASPHFILALPAGTMLREQYRIERVLGKPGGFGVTYLAEDLNLQRYVAIKEFLPRELAGRATDRTTVLPHSGEEQELFEWGLQRFIEEGRLLAQLDDHPNIVRVRSAFQANGTAYLVMDYYEGETLAEHRERAGGRITPPAAVAIMEQVLDGLAAAHAQGILHRDVKPENVYLRNREDGRIQALLLDFGAARQAVKDRSRGMTAMLSAGYAPLEQYSRSGAQGPWTDIYACAGLLYHLITGVVPSDAPERIDEDPLVPPRILEPSCPATLEAAILQGLAVRRQDRPQSVEEFKALLGQKSATAAIPSWRSQLRHPAALASMVILVLVAGALSIPRWFGSAEQVGGPGEVASASPHATADAAPVPDASQPADPVSPIEDQPEPPPPPERTAQPPPERTTPPPERTTPPPPERTTQPPPERAPTAGEIEALTSRLALGRFHFGQGRHDGSLAELRSGLERAAALRARYPAADTVRVLQQALLGALYASARARGEELLDQSDFVATDRVAREALAQGGGIPRNASLQAQRAALSDLRDRNLSACRMISEMRGVACPIAQR